jgi:hypothetical protein
MDEVVSMVYYEGSVLVITKRGKLFELIKDHSTQLIKIRIIEQLGLDGLR